MEGEAKGQVGGLDCREDVRRGMAGESGAWRCAVCGRSNGEILGEVEELVKGKGVAVEEKVPEELKMVYREDLTAPKGRGGEAAASSSGRTRIETPTTTAVRTQHRRVERSQDGWVDKAIYAVAALLLFLIARRLLSAIF